MGYLIDHSQCPSESVECVGRMMYGVRPVRPLISVCNDMSHYYRYHTNTLQMHHRHHTSGHKTAVQFRSFNDCIVYIYTRMSVCNNRKGLLCLIIPLSVANLLVTKATDIFAHGLKESNDDYCFQ